MRESVDVCSLRYTSIYSALRAARREKCLVTFFVYATKMDMIDRQEGREGAVVVVDVGLLQFLS